MYTAKSLQSCPTLCDPIDGSPPGSPVPGILQARTLEWVAISFSSAWKWKVKVKLLSHVWLLVTLWTAACQAPPSMGFSRQEYWSGVPLPSPTHMYSLPRYWHPPPEWCICYSWTCIDRPLPPKSIVYIMVHSWGCTFHGSVVHFQNLFIKHTSRLALTPFLFLGYRTMCDQYCISFADVEKAHINIRDFIHLTPVLTSSILNQITGRNLFFKCELFQKTGSFKVTTLFDSVSCFFSNHFHI